MVVEPFCPARIPRYVSAEPIKIPNTKVKIAPYCSEDICTVESNNSPFTAPQPTNSIAENNESATTDIAISCLFMIDIIKGQRNDYIKVLIKTKLWTFMCMIMYIHLIKEIHFQAQLIVD